MVEEDVEAEIAFIQHLFEFGAILLPFVFGWNGLVGAAVLAKWRYDLERVRVRGISR